MIEPDQTLAAKVARFRALHGAPFIIPNAWDVGSARLLAGLGFPAIATTSAGIAWAHGRPDGAAGAAVTLAVTRDIVGATSLPVSADLENGFGHAPEAVAETIRAAAAMGLSGASIEDASGLPEAPIYDAAAAVERVVAAVEAARGCAAPPVLTARAENFLHGRPDLDDTIRRLVAFAEAGAEVLYAPGLPTLDAIRAVCEAVGRPVNVLAGAGSPPFTFAELAAAGARRISVGSALARAALGGVLSAAQGMRERGDFGFTATPPRFATLDAMMTPKAVQEDSD